jgi:hypothetical protein
MGAVKTNSLLNNPDPNAVRRRPVLSLPTPRVSDTELESISKLGKSRFANDFNLEGGEDTPGASLLGDYARTPHGASSQGATPARTPSVGGQEAILREAMHLRNLARGQTPLLGGEKRTWLMFAPGKWKPHARLRKRRSDDGPRLFAGTFPGLPPMRKRRNFCRVAKQTPRRGSSRMNSPFSWRTTRHGTLSGREVTKRPARQTFLTSLRWRHTKCSRQPRW